MLNYDINSIIKTLSKQQPQSSNQRKIEIGFNSFQSSSKEYTQSEEILNILNGFKVKYTKFDINQEMKLSYKEKIKENIREKYKEEGVLLSLNGKISLPQVKIDKSLVLNYENFMLLHEKDLLKKVIFKEICLHIRFFKENIAYIRTNDDEISCIYCLSNKKINQKFKFLLPKRNNFDEEVDLILSICEGQRITFKSYDLDNKEYEIQYENDFPIEFSNSKSSMFILDGEVFYGFDLFGEIIERKLCFLNLNDEYSKVRKCEICEERLDPSLYEMRKCLSCLYVYSSGNSKKSKKSFFSCFSDYNQGVFKENSNSNSQSESSLKNKYNPIENNNENDLVFEDDSTKRLKLKVQFGKEYSNRKKTFQSLYNTDDKNENSNKTTNFIEKLGLKKVNYIKRLQFSDRIDKDIVTSSEYSSSAMMTKKDNQMYQSFGNMKLSHMIVQYNHPFQSISTIKTKESNQ